MMIHRGKMQVVRQSCAFFCGPFSFNVVVYCYICTMKMDNKLRITFTSFGNSFNLLPFSWYKYSKTPKLCVVSGE